MLFMSERGGGRSGKAVARSFILSEGGTSGGEARELKGKEVCQFVSDGHNCHGIMAIMASWQREARTRGFPFPWAKIQIPSTFARPHPVSTE